MRLLAVALSVVLFAAVPLAAQQAWQIGPFTRPANGNPILTPEPASTFADPILQKPVHWEALHAFNPAAIVRDDKIFVLYRAEDDSGTAEIGGHTSRLSLAESDDGVTFTRQSAPVFYPANDDQRGREWPGGVEDPRLVQAPDGTYVLTYTQWNRLTYSVGIATSPDLEHWTKHGPAFGIAGSYAQLKYKSAGILTRVYKGTLIAARIHDVFWMYWGEGAIHVATSPDLIHWTPLKDDHSAFLEVLQPRSHRFDSTFPEVGPPPVLTKQGIVVLYNGKNASGADADSTLGPGAYAAGEALFDADDPTHLLARTDAPVLEPQQPYEKTGQYAAGTTFAEGLVLFHKRWFLFYGCADSDVAYATAPYKQ
jgi:predicted GH43/DUF377 family glycosyl hydrolase